jgi:hypothetical protein
MIALQGTHKGSKRADFTLLRFVWNVGLKVRKESKNLQTDYYLCDNELRKGRKERLEKEVLTPQCQIALTLDAFAKYCEIRELVRRRRQKLLWDRVAQKWKRSNHSSCMHARPDPKINIYVYV